MGYGRAKLKHDIDIDTAQFEDVQRKASKKSLWGSIGRTAGGLLAMGLTGGLVNPVTLGLITGAATFAGGAIGARAAYGGRDLEKEAGQGKFFKSERKDLQSYTRDVGSFGSENVLGSLKAGVTAGVGQKAKLASSGKTATPLSEGFGLDFEGSLLGKGLAKRKAGQELATMRGWQGEYEALSNIDTDIGVSSTFGQGPGPSTSAGKVLNKPSMLDRFKGGAKELYESEKGRLAEISQSRGDKVGFMTSQEAGKYAQSQGWSAPQNVAGKSFSPQFDMDIKPTSYDSNYKPTLLAGDDWRNMSWQEKLGIGKGKYGNK